MRMQRLSVHSGDVAKITVGVLHDVPAGARLGAVRKAVEDHYMATGEWDVVHVKRGRKSKRIYVRLMGF